MWWVSVNPKPEFDIRRFHSLRRFVTLRIIWHKFLRIIWHNRPFLRDISTDATFLSFLKSTTQCPFNEGFCDTLGGGNTLALSAADATAVQTFPQMM
jgi:hypothetical protein